MSTNHHARLAQLKTKAAAQVAAYPQYARHFERYRLARINRTVVTKFGRAFTRGEIVIAVDNPPLFTHIYIPRTALAWSMSNRVDTSVSASDLTWL